MYRLQEAFKNSILYDDDSKLLSMIAPNHINATEYINIYRNNFYENLISSLSITYPTVKKLVGEDCFCSLAKLYVKRNCPKSSNLTNYGNKFPSFIK